MFEVGQTVMLFSGGALMTVKAVGGDQITCVWHDAQKKPQEQVYAANLLIADDGVPPAPTFG